MPKRGPREEEPFSPIDAHLVDSVLSPVRIPGIKPTANTQIEDSESRHDNDKVVSMTRKKQAPYQQPAFQSSTMSAGWKISTTPEDKRAIIAFVRDLNDTLGEDSNLGISNLGRALYMMVLKRKEKIFECAQGKKFIRPDNNDHASLAILEEALGDIIAEACFHAVRSERRG
jgi:hypothetical protein